MYIAEQQMVAAAVGMQTRGWKPFASSFGAFLSRAYDFVRMAAISDADLKLCGSHVGVSIGPDGPSQMALEDIASLRAVLGSVVLYPSDANQAVQLLDAMREHRGVSYMRTTREATPVLYGPDESFEIGGSHTVRSSDDDAITLIGAGITLRECLAAADELAGKGIAARVIDLYSVKPVDAETILEAAERDRRDRHRRGPLGRGRHRRDRRRRPRRSRLRHPSHPPRRQRASRQRSPGGPCSPPPASTPRTSSRRSSGPSHQSRV